MYRLNGATEVSIGRLCRPMNRLHISFRPVGTAERRGCQCRYVFAPPLQGGINLMTDS